MAYLQTLRAPSGVTPFPNIVIGKSGASYAVDTNGFVNITALGDAEALINNGWTGAYVAIPSQALSANNTTGNRKPLIELKNADGTTLAVAASAGKFGITLTPGTSELLTSEAALSNTKTDTCIIEDILPASYIAASPITFTVSAGLVGAGTLTTKTVGLEFWKVNIDGTFGANLVTTAAQTLTTAQADYAFNVSGVGCLPTDRFMARITVTLVETGAVSTVCNIGSVRRA